MFELVLFFLNFFLPLFALCALSVGEHEWSRQHGGW